MARPATAPKHDGAPCKRCGGTLYYDRNDSCVECTRIRNATGYRATPREKRIPYAGKDRGPSSAGRVQPVRTIGRAGPRTFNAALDGEKRSLDAAARSKYLDDLILTPTQRADPTPGYGEQRREAMGDQRREAMAAAGLVGAPPAMVRSTPRHDALNRVERPAARPGR